MINIEKRLFELKDLSYRDFHARLMPTVETETIIGIRIPVLKSFAKEIYGTEEAKDFIRELPHKYYEENNLHAFLIARIKDFDKCLFELERFLPFIDNWATCDSLRPACFKLNTDSLIKYIDKWLASDKPYVVRFGIEMLMVYYLDSEFDISYPEKIAEIESEHYYVNMMIAWYFATALAKKYEEILPYLEEKRLSVWVHNKTIQKACESYRISDDKKIYLKTLKRKM